MAIYLNPNADPFSLLAEPTTRAPDAAGEQLVPILAHSSAAQVLDNELARYCRGEIRGRSFLIGGHRGVGKTTMLDDVLLRYHRQALTREIRDRRGTLLSRRQPGPAVLKPLPVYLLGPALFDEGDEPGPGPAGAAGEQAPPRRRQQNAQDPGKMTQRVLVQAVLGLHHAVSQEFHARFRQLPAGTDGAEMAELVAQFRIELNEAPSPARLREYWRRVGRLVDGVLFPPDGRERQGWNEIVALTGMNHVFQRVNGLLQEQRDDNRSHSRTTELGHGVDARTAELVKSLAALGSGAAVGAAGAVSQGSAAGLLLGLVTAVGGALFLRLSSTTTSRRVISTDTKFVPDLTVKTLHRVMPDLLERLRSAGLAPVFVVDELDKVNDLARRIDPLIRDLKKLFAESSFTCLLVDRGYYEYLLIRDEQEQHGDGSPPPTGAAGVPPAAQADTGAMGRYFSYFSHRVFVTYRPVDLHDYLQRLLRVEPDDPAQQDGAEVLRWVLLHRARLNPLQLNREIEALRGEDDRLRVPPHLAQLQHNRIDVTLQCAVELALARPELAAWVARRPRMHQPLIDAAYYVSACFERDQTRQGQGHASDKLDLTATGREAFRGYLLHRMNLYANESAPKDQEAKARWAQERRAVEDGALPEQDLRRLYEVARQVALTVAYTAHRDAFEEAWRAAQAEQPDALSQPSRALFDLLLLGATAQGQRILRPVDDGQPGSLMFRWLYLPSGQASPDGTRHRIEDEGPRVEKRWQALQRLLNEAAWPDAPEVSDERDTLRRMIEQVQLIRSSERWPMLRQAAVSMARPAPTTPERELADQLARLREFLDRCQADPHLGAALHRALVCAAAVEGLADLPKASPGLEVGLEALGRGLRFDACTTKSSAERLRQLQAAIADTIGETLRPPTQQAPSPWPEAAALRADVGHAFTLGRAAAAAAALEPEAYWKAVAERVQAERENALRSPTPGAEPVAATLTEIRGWLARKPEQRPVDLDLFRMTLRRWTTVLRLALAPQAGDLPRWMAAQALERLGAASLDSDAQQQLLEHLARPPDTSSATDELRDEVARRDLWNGPRLHRRAALVVTSKPRSVSDAWNVSPGAGLVLVATVPEALELLAAGLVQALRAWGQPLRLAIEQPAPARQDLARLRAYLQAHAGGSELCWIYGERHAGQQTPALIAPRSADELWSRAASPTAP